MFPALLNAVHKKKIVVRLLTNDYNQKTCDGLISPLDWLSLNGIEIRYYTSTTFMHAKYMIIDKGKKTSVSSVNFSHTSFMRNREAGVVLTGTCSTATDFYTSVFDSDWNNGLIYNVSQKYNSTTMKYITDPASLPVDTPPPPNIPGSYVSPLNTYNNVQVKKVYTAPDFALETLSDTLKAVKSSFYLMIYQITGTTLCNDILNLYNKGIDLRLLVSSRIYSYSDWKSAQVRSLHS